MVESQRLQLYNKETPTRMFSCEYCEIFKNSFCYRTPPVAASVESKSEIDETLKTFLGIIYIHNHSNKVLVGLGTHR